MSRDNGIIHTSNSDIGRYQTGAQRTTAVRGNHGSLDPRDTSRKRKKAEMQHHLPEDLTSCLRASAPPATHLLEEAKQQEGSSKWEYRGSFLPRPPRFAQRPAREAPELHHRQAMRLSLVVRGVFHCESGRLVYYWEEACWLVGLLPALSFFARDDCPGWQCPSAEKHIIWKR